MVKEELIKRSPLRVFEQSLQGEKLGKGSLGMLTSRKGVGKTACLVHIATDKLFRGEHVIHVSFSANVNRIIAWYTDIFDEIARKRSLEHVPEVREETVRNRVIMNFNQHHVTISQIIASLRALIVDGGFHADAIMFDGYRLNESPVEDFKIIRKFARTVNAEVWFSISALDDDVPYDAFGVSDPVRELAPHVDVLISLTYVDDHVELTVVKDREDTEPRRMQLKLDPKTLLIVDESERIES